MHRKNIMFKKRCVQSGNLYTPIGKLNTSFLITFSKLLNSLKYVWKEVKSFCKELNQWNSLKDPDEFLPLLKMFLRVYRNNWKSSAHPQSSWEVFKVESKFPHLNDRESCEPILG